MNNCLFKGRDEGGEIYVWENNGHRWLTFDDHYCQTKISTDSPDILLEPYLKEIKKVLYLFGLQNRKEVKILVGGLGGGSILHFFNTNHPNWKVTVVEKRPKVIDIAYKYFCIKQKLNTCRIKNDDIFNHVHQSCDQYDLIIIDLDVQSVCQYIELIDISPCRLKTNGVFIINTACFDHNSAEQILATTTQLHNGQSFAYPIINTQNMIITVWENMKIGPKIKHNVILQCHHPCYGTIVQSIPSG